MEVAKCRQRHLEEGAALVLDTQRSCESQQSTQLNEDFYILTLLMLSCISLQRRLETKIRSLLTWLINIHMIVTRDYLSRMKTAGGLAFPLYCPEEEELHTQKGL